MKKSFKIIFITVIAILITGCGFTLYKANASDNGWPTEPVTLVDHDLLTAPQGNKTAVWCWYKYSNGQQHTVYGGLVDTAQLKSGYIHFGCQKN